MKFMVSWKVHEDQRHDALKTFTGMSANDAADAFGGLEVIGRWHDLVGFTGVAIVETNDPNALAAWPLKRNHSIDIQSIPVFDDDKARAVGRQALD